MKTQKLFSVLLMLAVYVGAMIFNDGFMGTDEYFTGITRYVPAQKTQLSTMMKDDDVKSPTQILPAYSLAKLALRLGYTAPYDQYRFVQFVFSSVGLLILLFSLLLVRPAYDFLRYDRMTESLFLYFTFYFGMAFALTRPMFESMAMPWLTLAAVTSLRYSISLQLKWLLCGVIAVSIAFMLRPQIGLCAIVFLVLPLVYRQYRHFGWVMVVGLFFFAISGLPDLLLRGQFHYSLLAVTFYNFKHGADYGTQPWYFYLVLLIALTFAPFFIARYPQGYIKTIIKQLWPVLTMIVLFIFLHSLFSQKWERFLIPILPLILFVMFPLVVWMASQWKSYKLRISIVFFINSFLFVIASFFPPQKNLIEMSRHLDRNSNIRVVYTVNQTPEWITDAFIQGALPQFKDMEEQQLQSFSLTTCAERLVLAAPLAERFANIVSPLTRETFFKVNLVEQWAYRLNPKHNVRRVQLNMYKMSSCAQSESSQ